MNKQTITSTTKQDAMNALTAAVVAAGYSVVGNGQHAMQIVARGHGGEVRIGWFDINVGTPALRAYYEGSLSMPRVKLPAGLIDLSYSTSPTHMIVRWVP
jgi:hypothetical protein